MPGGAPDKISDSLRKTVIPYPPIEHHGIIGDRRTAALIAADGTLDWLCLPDADSSAVFGVLLDWSKGGYWRLGPAQMVEGEQVYLEDTMVLETRWNLTNATLVLCDAMLWPESERAPAQQQSRVVVRHLRCTHGKARCQFDLQPACNFQSPSTSFFSHASGWSLSLGELSFRLWSSQGLEADGSRLHQEFELQEGGEIWAVFELGAGGHGWSMEAAKRALDQTTEYWRRWLQQFQHPALKQGEIRRAAMTIHLLSYAPEGSVLAAATTSLPERIGGGWNADYRLSWVRDASLAVSLISRLGYQQETEQYLQWLARYKSRWGRPFQVLYGLRGEKRPRQRQLSEVRGYRGSQPVRIGNHAYKQHQLGSQGFLADCAWIYLQHGGSWRAEYWDLIRRAADYTTKHWQEPENGIWELASPKHYVQSKVLNWVTLDRAIKIAQRANPSFDVTAWEETRLKIHQEVMDRGWSQRLGAFRQHYEADDLDAAALLISVFEFLPGEHPRVLATIERIAERLTINGFVFRFDPLQADDLGDWPLGQFEGAFLPCTFWLATAYAKAGCIEQARQIIERVEKLASPLGLFAEAIDPRTRGFLGNTPLLFSHVEYVRAKLELAHRSVSSHTP